MKDTAFFDDANKESSQETIEDDDAVSVVSSSTSTAVNKGIKIKNLRGFRKTTKNLGSFRRRGRMKAPSSEETSSDSSPNYTKATSCSEGKKAGYFQASPRCSESSLDSSDQSRSTARSSLKTLTRSSSLKAVMVGFKSRKHFVVKPTCASAIKNSKFPERTSGHKVCSYHHCSLNAHSTDSPNPRRRLPKSEKRAETSQISPKPIDSVTEDSVVRETLIQIGKTAENLANKEKHMNVWNLIQQHMGSNLAEDSSQLTAEESSDSCNSIADQEIEARKLFAIKMVREAIEKILLPEVADQSSDNQSITSETSQDQENESSLVTDSNGCQEKVKTMKAPKHWSNLKKWILLQRFVKELEKVKKINPMKTRQLQADQDPEQEEGEKIQLRPLMVDERKRTEEWMLDYALRQAICQLAPTQKRKVELLVRAFETVVPPQGGDITQVTLHKFKSSSQEQVTIKEDESPTDANESIFQDKKANPLIESLSGREGNNGEDRINGEKQKYISMWHMISQHVLSGLISKVGTDDDVEDAITVGETKADHSCQDLPSVQRSNFSRDDAIELVREAVNEILITQVHDDSSDTKSVTSEGIPEINQIGDGEADESIVKEHEKKEVSLAETKPALSKSKNWSKLKKLLLLKRSITALQNARKPKFTDLPKEPDKVDLRHQMIDERRKAEQWMLDYAVQNIVTKLTPARKRRVAMLVEAFEAVVPLPQV